MPHADADGVKLYFEETGTGHPIVFVHEFASDCREWEQQVRYFSRNYRCITYNARGYPPSDVPGDASQYGYAFAADDIAHIMAAAGIGKAHIVGLSMGGYAALMFGLRHPEKASALVAAGAGSGSPPPGRERWAAECERSAQRLADDMAGAAQEMGHRPTRIQLKHKDPRGWDDFVQHLSGHSPHGMSMTMANYQGKRPSLHDYQDQFRTMALPVLLAVGDEDAPCLETNLMLKACIPGAGLWVAPNTGHAINLEEPAAFNEQVQMFFDAVARGTWPSQHSA